MRGQVDLYRLHENAEDGNGLSERKEEEPDEEELRIDELLSMDKLNLKCQDDIEPSPNSICSTDDGEEEGGDEAASKEATTEKGMTTDLRDFEDL